MRVKKYYGLVFEDMSVKKIEVIAECNKMNSQCLDILRNELQNYIDRSELNPISIIPDTGCYCCIDKVGIKTKEVDSLEREEFLAAYHNDIEFYEGSLYNSKIV